jgi:hypothetical protein
VARQAARKDLILDHLTNDRLHVCLCKRSQRLRANISKGATAQSKRGHGMSSGASTIATMSARAWISVPEVSLQKKQFKPVRIILPGLIPEGLNAAPIPTFLQLSSDGP